MKEILAMAMALALTLQVSDNQYMYKLAQHMVM